MIEPKIPTAALLNSTHRRNVLCLLASLSVQAGLARLGFAATEPAKIAMIGAGRMGSTIGTMLVKAGHEVMFSSRHPEELKALVDGLGPRAHAGTVADAVKFSDTVILTVPYSAMPDLAKDYGKALAAKPLVIDVSNAVPARDGEIGKMGREKGAGIYLQELIPGVKNVRAFNAMHWESLPEWASRQGGNKVAVPILGEDPKAIALAEGLIRDIGFEPVLVGGLALSNYTAPGGPLVHDHTAAEVRKIAAGLK